MNFTVAAVPTLIQQILERGALTMADIDYLLLHQATSKMLVQLRQTIGVEEKRLPIRLQHCGNTVSSTLPILIHDLRSTVSCKMGCDPSWLDLELVGVGQGVFGVRRFNEPSRMLFGLVSPFG